MSSKLSNPIPVTVAIPVRNEEANLAACLERLRRFDDVVVIDSGSTDKTREIALEHGARVVDFEWNGKYPKKRNWFLINHPPENPWVLFLDADEFIDDPFCSELEKSITSSRNDGYWIKYTNYFLGKPLRHGLVQRKLALFRVGKALYEKIEEDHWSALDMEIHEHPVVDGTVGEIRAPIDHRDYKGLDRFLNKHVDYALWEARRYKALQKKNAERKHFTSRQHFKYRHVSKPWYSHFYFFYTYFVKLGFLDGGAGYQYAAYKAWYFRTIRLLINETPSSRMKSKSE